MPWYIYGKRVREWRGLGPDTMFRALDKKGIRVSRLADAYGYATKEEAEQKLNKEHKHGIPQELLFEIRFK